MSVQVSYKKQTIIGFLLILIMIISVEGVLRAYDFQYPNCRLTNSDVFSNFDEITSKENKKSLMAPLKKHAGRNNKGKITVRHRGGGHKRKFRIIDFKRIKTGIEGIVESIQYDPNRSSNLALIKYNDGEWAYILSPEGLKVGNNIISSKENFS